MSCLGSSKLTLTLTINCIIPLPNPRCPQYCPGSTARNQLHLSTLGIHVSAGSFSIHNNEQLKPANRDGGIQLPPGQSGPSKNRFKLALGRLGIAGHMVHLHHLWAPSPVSFVGLVTYLSHSLSVKNSNYEKPTEDQYHRQGSKKL